MITPSALPDPSRSVVVCPYGDAMVREGSAARGRADGGLPVVAAAIALVAWLLAGTATVLHVAAGGGMVVGDLLFTAVDITVAAVYGTVGAVILSRRRHPVGWLVAVTGVAGGVSAVAGAWGALAATRPGLPSPEWLVAMFGWVWVPGTVSLFTVVPWLARDRGLGPAARAGVALGATAALLLTGTRLLAPMSDPRWALALVVVAGLVTSAGTWWRFRHGPEQERRGLGVLAVAAGIMALSFIPLVLTDPGPGIFLAVPVSHLVCQALFPAALLVTVLRNRLWGLDLAVSRGTVAALLALVLAGVYAAVTAGVSALAGASSAGAQVAAAVGVVLLLQPVRGWLQARVRHLVYGDGHDPARAALRLGRTLTAPGGSAELLDGLVASVGESLRLESVRLATTDADPLTAAWGAPTSEALHVPVEHAGRVVGDLAVTPPPGERLDTRTRAALGQVLPVVAAGLALAAGARDLERARDAATSARLRERRVVRRELHDGLGPWLSGVRLGLQGAVNLLDTGTPAGAAAAREALQALGAEAERRVEDVRDLARSLLPPVLDEQGLGPALDDLADRLARDGFVVTRDGDDPGELDPVVAAAAYALLSEAARNARRHSGAPGCRLTVHRGAGALELVCEDDGRGPGGVAGIGTRSMQERAEELGGFVEVGAREPGTRVRAVLPLVPGAPLPGGPAPAARAVGVAVPT
ncbi:putative sensor histidine kinase NarS [Cellulomonas hominis]|nr:putative sensor histidine kinase NarS [Cellulomonas hominis]